MSEYIDRNEAYDAVLFATCGTGHQYEATCAIDRIPEADVAPVAHGSWDGTADGYADGELVYDMWNCSVCGFDADGADEKPAWKFCPNCGAKMDGKERQNNE